MRDQLAYLQQRLEERAEAGIYRELFVPQDCVDFCSNDYLGMARSAELSALIEEAAAKTVPAGSTGSRLISGDSLRARKLEEKLSRHYQAESCLLFNSGYDANLGFFSSVPWKEDLVIYDELCHASIIDGIRLGRASSIRFAHNDLSDLEKKLQIDARYKYVSVESVYSMDGDFCPLEAVLELCKKYGAALVVDEAHAGGVYGPMGAGRSVELGLADQIFARVHTFGKAVGVHGAIVAGGNSLRNYLINHARSFIYTTMLPPHSLISIEMAHDILSKDQHKQNEISDLCLLFDRLLDEYEITGFRRRNGPIRPLILGESALAKRISAQLLERKIYAKAILSPTVPRGSERLRICLHTFNTEAEMRSMLSVIKSELNG